MRDDHPVAGAKLGDPVAGGDDLAAQLVAENGAGGGAAGVELEQVGPAKARHAQAQENLPGTGRCYRPWLQGRPVAARAGDHLVAPPRALIKALMTPRLFAAFRWHSRLP